MESIKHSAGVTLFEIDHEVYNLSFLWDLYSQIFRKKHEEPLPFSVAPGFFSYIHKALRENIVATIVRLFDPAVFIERNGTKHANIGYFYLIEQLKDENYPEEEIHKLCEKVNLIKEQFKATIILYRNKRLGHNDYQTIRDNDYKQVIEPFFSTPNLIEAVGSIYELTNDFEDLLMQKIMPPENAMDFYAHPQRTDFSHTSADADKLIEAINRALK
ncbi:MAG: hypothetical protein ABFD51_04130 [Anaerolineaceae bacterium]